MIFLTSFADLRLERSVRRLSLQARDLGVFERVFMYHEGSLPPRFQDKYKDKLIAGSRGFGYWVWKPEIIKITLDLMEDDDLLLYLDAGCHLNKRGLWRLFQYFDLTRQSRSGVVAFQALHPNPKISPLHHDNRPLFDQPNYHWIKGDLFDYFGVRDDQRFTHSQAIGSGIILFRKCKESQAIVEEWESVISSDFALIDDTPSTSPNLEGFIEHRHDQSIFTLLCLKHQVETLSAYEYWYPKKGSGRLEPDWDALSNFPIHARRDKDLGWMEKNRRKSSRLVQRGKSIFEKCSE